MSTLINGTCKDCAHWAGALHVPNPGDRDVITAANCGSVFVASALSSAGIVGEFMTRRDFGCIHWKEKP